MLDLTAIQRHVAKIDADGYSIVERAIEPDFVDALVEDLHRLERELTVVPAKNRFVLDYGTVTFLLACLSVAVLSESMRRARLPKPAAGPTRRAM